MANYINPISKQKEIFTREDIAKMPTKEFEQNEQKIMMQMNSIGIPTDNDVKSVAIRILKIIPKSNTFGFLMTV